MSVFDNNKLDSPFSGQGGGEFPNNIKNFTPRNTIPGVSGGLNTPASKTIVPISNFVPSGMAPNTDPPPMSDGGTIVEQKQTGVFDSGNNMGIFSMPFNGSPKGNAGGGNSATAIDNQKQNGENPFGKPF